MTYAYVWALVTPAVIWWAEVLARRSGMPGHLLSHAGLLVVLLPAIGSTVHLIVGPENWPFDHFTWPKLLRSVELTFDTGTLIYVGVVGMEHAFAYYRRDPIRPASDAFGAGTVAGPENAAASAFPLQYAEQHHGAGA